MRAEWFLGYISFFLPSFLPSFLLLVFLYIVILRYFRTNDSNACVCRRGIGRYHMAMKVSGSICCFVYYLAQSCCLFSLSSSPPPPFPYILWFYCNCRFVSHSFRRASRSACFKSSYPPSLLTTIEVRSLSHSIFIRRVWSSCVSSCEIVKVLWRRLANTLALWATLDHFLSLGARYADSADNVTRLGQSCD